MTRCMIGALKGKAAVITGVGSGIGKSMVERYLAEGASVVAADINEASLKALLEELEPEYGDKLKILKVNVSSKEEVEAMIDYTVEAFGKVDVVINNAGILDNLLPIAEMPDDVWERIMNINLNSVMYACRKAVQYFLKEKREGTIINTASLSGLCAGRGGLAYTTSKFAVVGLTKNVAFMYSDAGIRCNALCPGAIESNIGSGMREPSKLGLTKAVTGNSGRHRNGSADEVATAAVFLASDAASFINGETLTIDGGWSAY